MKEDEYKEAQQNEEGVLESKEEGLGILGALFLSGGVTMFGALLIPAYQAFNWLKTGQWQSLSTTALFGRILPDNAWEYLNSEPSSWVGVHKIVSYICCDMSLFLFVFLIGLIVIYGVSSFVSSNE